MAPEPRRTVLVDVVDRFRPVVDQAVVVRAVDTGLRVGFDGAGAGAIDLARRDLEVSVRVTDDREMRELNLRYRGIDRTTDVLSFSLLADGPPVPVPPEWPIQLGEIVLSVPAIEKQAAELGHAFETELAWLAIHGALQLLGYTHDSDEAATRMEALEMNALQSLRHEAE